MAERCKACAVYKDRVTPVISSFCYFIQFKISYLCPCYDCIVITTCQMPCLKHENIMINLRIIKKYPNQKDEILKFLEEKFEVNSLKGL